MDCPLILPSRNRPLVLCPLVLSGRINFVSFSTTWIFCFPKIPMKYSKNGQKFAMSKNTSNMLFEPCWTLCKKPHLSTWSRSRYTFFWMTRYFGKILILSICLYARSTATPPFPHTHTYTHTHIHTHTLHSLIYQLTKSLTLSLIHSLIHSFSLSFFHLLTRPFTCSLTHSLVLLLIHSFKCRVFHSRKFSGGGDKIR